MSFSLLGSLCCNASPRLCIYLQSYLLVLGWIEYLCPGWCLTVLCLCFHTRSCRMWFLKVCLPRQNNGGPPTMKFLSIVRKGLLVTGMMGVLYMIALRKFSQSNENARLRMSSTLPNPFSIGWFETQFSLRFPISPQLFRYINCFQFSSRLRANFI